MGLTHHKGSQTLILGREMISRKKQKKIPNGIFDKSERWNKLLSVDEKFNGSWGHYALDCPHCTVGIC